MAHPLAFTRRRCLNSSVFAPSLAGRETEECAYLDCSRAQFKHRQSIYIAKIKLLIIEFKWASFGLCSIFFQSPTALGPAAAPLINLRFDAKQDNH